MFLVGAGCTHFLVIKYTRPRLSLQVAVPSRRQLAWHDAQYHISKRDLEQADLAKSCKLVATWRKADGNHACLLFLETICLTIKATQGANAWMGWCVARHTDRRKFLTWRAAQAWWIQTMGTSEPQVAAQLDAHLMRLNAHLMRFKCPPNEIQMLIWWDLDAHLMRWTVWGFEHGPLLWALSPLIALCKRKYTRQMRRGEHESGWNEGACLFTTACMQFTC